MALNLGDILNQLTSSLGLGSNLSGQAGLGGIGNLAGMIPTNVAGGAGLVGAGSFFNQEPGFAVEARQNLRNQFNAPVTPNAALGTSTNYLTGLVNAPPDPLGAGGTFNRYLPAIQQQESDVLRKLKTAYSSQFPASVAGPSGSELDQAGQVTARFAQNREQLIADLIREQQARQIQGSELLQRVPGVQNLDTQNRMRAAEDLLGYAKPNPLGSSLGTLGTILALGGTQQDSQAGIIKQITDALGGGGQPGAQPGTSPASNRLGQIAGDVAATMSLANSLGLGGRPQTEGGAPGSVFGAGGLGSIATLAHSLGLFGGEGAGAAGAGALGTGATSAGAAGAGAGTAATGTAAAGTGVAGAGAGGIGALAGPAAGIAAAAALAAGLYQFGKSNPKNPLRVVSPFSLLGSHVANVHNKAVFRSDDLDSQRDQVNEIGNIGSTFLSELGADQSTMDGWKSFIDTQAAHSDSPGDEQGDSAAHLANLLQQVSGKAPSQIPGLRQRFIDFMMKNTFTSGDSSYHGGPPANFINQWAGQAMLG